MEGIITFLTAHSALSPVIVFGLILLAGLNIPISIDVLLVFSAVGSATYMPHMFWPLYIAFVTGCIASASLSYCIGRFCGNRLNRIWVFNKLLNEERVAKMSHFYHKYGFWTFLVGRFIPFGVRNGFFLSQGVTKIPYRKFLLYDTIACLIWATTFFFTLFSLGQNYDTVLPYLKRVNLLIFSVFAVIVVLIFGYKRLFKKR